MRKAGNGDLRRLADALARAFHADPFWDWLFRGDRRPYEPFVAAVLDKLYLGLDETYTTADVSGGACWVPPGEWHIGLADRVRLTPPLVAGVRHHLPRMLRFSTFIERRHPRDAHWYLPILGVEPEAQGRGLGTALLRPVLDRCDAEGLPAYLEATTVRSRALYERVGFEQRGEWRISDSPPLWPMWREPHGPVTGG